MILMTLMTLMKKILNNRLTLKAKINRNKASNIIDNLKVPSSFCLKQMLLQHLLLNLLNMLVKFLKKNNFMKKIHF